jgi:hypothetical protein
MDLDDPHHIRLDVHLKYAGKSAKREKYKVKNWNESNSNLQLIQFKDITHKCFY